MNIIKLHAIDSTNNYLKELARKESLSDLTIVVAEEQLKGRGQRGNGWYSTKEGSLAFSIYKEFEALQVQDHFKIAMAVSLAILKVFEGFEIPAVAIKWPNDIMSAGKKVVGILIENTLSGNRIKSAVIGIGINVSIPSFPDLPNAGSLTETSSKSIDKEALLMDLLKACQAELGRMEKTSYAEMQQEYESRLFRKDKISVFREPDSGRQFNAIIRGISRHGELLIETETQILRQVGVKELKMDLGI